MNTIEIARLVRNPFTLVPEANTQIWADYVETTKLAYPNS